MQEPTLACAPRQFVRVNNESRSNKVVHFYRELLYVLAINDITNSL
jgi:hypothetical protein